MDARELVERHLQTFNAHDAAGWGRDYAENAVLHDPQYAEPLRGRDAIQKDIEDFFNAFPDVQFDTATIVGSGQAAAIEGVGSGTHQGAMNAPSGTIEPTNKHMALPFAAFVKTSPDGLILEESRYYDLAGMMTQLGLAAG